MDSPPKLAGETLIVHHIPLVHCQVSGSRQRCSPLKRSNPFSCPENLGLSRTTSLPERDVLQREALLYSSLIQTASAKDDYEEGGGRGGKGGSTGASDTSSLTSSNSEEPPLARCGKRQERPRSLRHNPFLLNSNEDQGDEEEDEDDDGDNLNGYLEDSSFHLHGIEDPNAGLGEERVLGSFHLHEFGLSLDPEPFLLHGTLDKPWSSAASGHPGAPDGQDRNKGGTFDFSARLELLGLDGGQRRHGSSGSTLSMDCGEQEWGDEDEDEEGDDHGRGSRAGSSDCSSSAVAPHCSCCGLSQPYSETFSEPFSENQLGYGSDSSCNSSDGVLVNFSTIYNKMNNLVPAKPPPINLNSSAQHSCSSSLSEPHNAGSGLTETSGGGAFYLDLHTSPTEPPPQPVPTTRETTNSTSSCGCPAQSQGTVEVDANCNSYHNHLTNEDASANNDLTSCLQSQARLVVATQNYYKLVTCDLSSQSSPSPAGSSVTSSSDEPSKGSPTQPTEYYLFGRPAGEEEEEEEEEGENTELSQQNDEKSTHSDPVPNVIEGQVYVNVSPPVSNRGMGGATGGRQRSRSYDRHLDKSPPPRLGSLERMLSCPVRLSEGAAPCPPPPPRVTSFAEIARNKRRGGVGGATGGSPSLKASMEGSSIHSQSSGEFSPIPEVLLPRESHSLPPLTRCYSQGSCDQTLPLRDCMGAVGKEARTKAEGGLTSSSPGVVRYSKDQRPTTLPIQPFTFQHQFGKSQPKPLLPLLNDYISHMQGRGGAAPKEDEDEPPSDVLRRAVDAPSAARPSPLGSYSPVRIQGGAPSSGTCSTCTPSPDRAPGGPRPPRSLSCPVSAGLLPQRTPTKAEHQPKSRPLPPTPPPAPLSTRSPLVQPTARQAGLCFHGDGLAPLPTLPATGLGATLGHLEPVRHQAGKTGVTTCMAQRQTNGQLQQYYSDFLPDYFSQTERPPEEFCLSPDASSDESISIDLLQKRGLVKSINTAVDLIVAHFGTSRDAGVKAKLGNSSVSPNVGHLILKYLCPAIRELLQDGLRPYVLDLIIGQRRNQPWSIVEASTQLGPSTRVLHSLFTKVCQYSELTNHSMRLNAFIFGLLNLRSLEFWFNHIYTHDDIIAAHYHPWGFLPLSQGPCQPLFEELLLLLQPLSLLPFDLDLLFEPHLLQKGRDHLRRKEQLCSAGQGLDQSARSTFQLMRGWVESRREGAGSSSEAGEMQTQRFSLMREGAVSGMERAESKRGTVEQRREGAGSESVTNRVWPGSDSCSLAAGGMEGVRMSAERVKGVGGECQREGQEDGERERKSETRDSTTQALGGAKQKNKQAGWWYQLMQSSQVYIDNSSEGSRFVKWEKRKKSGTEGRRQAYPPLREGVVEGAEATQEVEEQFQNTAISSNTKCGNGYEPSAHTGSANPAKVRPSWMGSPPESVLNELKKSEERVPETQGADQGGPQPATAGDASAQGMRWGRLFGAVPSAKTEKTEQKPNRSQKSRLPSGWLSLDTSVLDFVVQTVGAGRRLDRSQTNESPEPSPAQEAQPIVAQQQAPCEVQALCHHIASEPGHLSFQKGDILRVLGRADADWLRCSLGDREGLVPIIYVTLNEENQGSQESH
ncbi:iporin [Chanos chanos]|uniref:Iporin n=1 Tax=Chanos chanos TaxID=29144 RepID=A0A6J2WSG3_CHACN|nr:iporin-like [Chanos chanos]